MTEPIDDPVRLGGWCHLPSAFAAEIVIAAGCDWCCVDRQHGFADESAMFDMLRTIDLAGATPVVRVSAALPAEIGRALDAGARAVIIPNVVSAAEAAIAAAACRFMPVGTRSYTATRTQLYATRAEPECHVMIETSGAWTELEMIAATPGIAGLFLGPADLRLSMGDDTNLAAMASRLVSVCKENGITPGVFAGTAEAAIEWAERGFEFIAVAADSAMLRARAVSDFDAVREHLTARR